MSSANIALASVDPRRIRQINAGTGDAREGPVVYWMSRDQRVNDNWALLHAQDIAMARGAPLIVMFCMTRDFLGAQSRQYWFMLKGLAETGQDLSKLSIPFYIVQGHPGQHVPSFVKVHGASHLVTDFSPLRVKAEWMDAIKTRLEVPVDEVDAHNIVPCWIASGKQEFSARFFRPKIKRWLHDFLTDYPAVARQATQWKETPRLTAATFLQQLDEGTGDAVGIHAPFEPGCRAGSTAVDALIQDRLPVYSSAKNDPTKEATSGLSPYLHFGQVSAQRVALSVERTGGVSQETRDAFLEELVVRRELSDNYCYYNKNYDSFEGFPDWARNTLDEHRLDPREYMYSIEDLEHARTHDQLWNAAQLQMVHTGYMHGWVRMYWAKKVLEWSESPEAAVQACIYLNDKYELDGRDPNGYVGIAWSIGGLHDRAWNSRPVFGKIRYMSFNGARSKFKVQSYIDRCKSL